MEIETKLLRLLTRRERVAREKQQERILYKDFPWMWAVRSTWPLGFHEIHVFNPDSGLAMFLKQGSGAGVPEVWVASSNLVYFLERRLHLGVQRVNGHDGSNWANAILESISPGTSIQNVVVIRDCASQNEGRKCFDIYRKPKEELSFNRLLSQIPQL